MGSGIHISCNTCDIELDAMLGFGFSGIPRYACACDTCKTLVVVSGPPVFENEYHEIMKDLVTVGEELEEEDDSEPFTCKKCKNPLRILGEKFDADDEDGDSSWGACPRCGGELRGGFNGILWD